ncbi:Serine/threonine-protein phosphatase 6 regulatory ankyrin repeat subunit A [Cichlidogyrus casuarinus]|uniref:Serine/threonine-protein phosphatase 6 regulatory ankyrin repeat subunit A n=1 Tax=Cichlidogyrus casuarinus TaxID=1844966 RepID=A0ABD2PVU8_9PLAT
MHYTEAWLVERIQDKDLVNQRDHYNRTPAHLAITTGLPLLLEKLIARGANMYAVDQDGRIPALSCAQTPQIAECLSLCLAAMFPALETVGTQLRESIHKSSSRDLLESESDTPVTGSLSSVAVKIPKSFNASSSINEAAVMVNNDDEPTSNLIDSDSEFY